MTNIVRVLAAVGLCVSACTGTDDARSSVRDSADVRIVTNRLDDGGEISTCVVHPEPLLSIGAAEGIASSEFTEVAGIVRLSHGHYVVLDRRTKELRFFDAQGAHVRTVGRGGEGPAEFRDPIQLMRRGGDSLVVFDWDLQRVSWFTPSGEFVHSINLRPAQANPVPDIHLVGAEATIWIAIHSPRIPSGSEVVDQTLQLLRFDRLGQLVDTVATLPYGSMMWVNQAAGMVGRPLFEAQSVWTAHTDRVIVATGLRDEIEVWANTGGVDLLVRWLGLSRAVTSELLDQYRADRLAPHLGTPREATMRRRYEEMPVAEKFPAVAGLLVDPSGLIWARQYPVPGTTDRRWLAFNLDGHFRCRATFADAFDVHTFDGRYALGTRRDSLDVPYVVVHRIEGVADRT